MRFVLDIECDNAAFEGESRGPEAARILKKVAFDLELNYTTFPRISDENGNSIGWAGYFEGASYNELKAALSNLLDDFEDGMECDAPDSVIEARKLLGQA